VRGASNSTLIVGGGPAGAAAAIVIARAGREVTVIERNVGPTDKVCGDFLSTEAISALAALGVTLPTTAPITSLRLVHGKRVATVQLPFTAAGLTRRVLDEALLQQAAASGATVLRGHSAQRVSQPDGLLRVDCGRLGQLSAGAVFLATGKHELRGAARASRGTGLVGMKMYYTLVPRQIAELRNHVELVLFDGGYAGLQLVESERAVLCILLPASRLRDVEGRWDSLMQSLIGECPHLAARLTGARATLERPLTIAGLPYGFIHAANPNDPPGLFRVGDQAAVIPSLTGDGVALALSSATLAARTWLQQGNVARHYHRGNAALIARQMRVATAIHGLCCRDSMQAWVVAACRLWPGAMRLAAGWTRLG
jgi:flavin-dependent dehydrogenase